LAKADITYVSCESADDIRTAIRHITGGARNPSGCVSRVKAGVQKASDSLSAALADGPPFGENRMSPRPPCALHSKPKGGAWAGAAR